MLDLTIDRLQLNITNAAGHEHRLQPIVLRAVGLLADGLDERRWSGQDSRMGTLNTAAISLDLYRMSDAEAAQVIADAWLEALALKLRV